MIQMRIYEEALAHYATGISLSISDRMFSKNSKRFEEERISQKMQEVTDLKQIAYIESLPNKDQERNTKEYRETIFRTRKIFNSINYNRADNKSSWNRYFSNFKDSERINNLKPREKLGVAFGLEFVVDSAVIVSQIAWGRGNGVAAFGESLYQAPSMWLGFLTGRVLLHGYDAFFKSKEEKILDELKTELTQDGKLLEIVRNYTSTELIETPKTDEIDVGEIDGIEGSNGPKVKTGSVTGTIVGATTTIAYGVAKGLRDVKNEITLEMQRRKQETRKERELRKKQLRERYDKY